MRPLTSLLLILLSQPLATGQNIVVDSLPLDKGGESVHTLFLADEENLPPKSIWMPTGKDELPLKYSKVIAIARKAAAEQGLPDAETLPVNAALKLRSDYYDRRVNQFPSKACPYYYRVVFKSPNYPVYQAVEEVFVILLDGTVARRKPTL